MNDVVLQNDTPTIDLPKIPKPLVLYGDPPPAIIRGLYNCKNCIGFYESNGAGKCIIIEGDISPDKWCIMWLIRFPPNLSA